MNIDIKEDDENIIYSTTQKMFTKVIDIQEKETIKEIEKYCEENNIIPNLIDKDKLKLVLRLGINTLNERGQIKGLMECLALENKRLKSQLRQERNIINKQECEIHNLQEELKSIKSNYKIQLEYDEELEAKLEMYENGVYFSSENDELQQRIGKALDYSQQLKDSIDKSKFDGMTKTILILGINKMQGALQGSDKNE